jgi:benzoyl-CoA 2,3-dioxygenase component B
VQSAIDDIVAAGAAWWPLQMARELDDAILMLRTNDLDIGTWVLKTTGDAALALGADAALDANRGHWFVRETIGMLRRTLARLDVTSRTLIALVERDSCFAGTLAELLFAADRGYMLSLPDAPAEEGKVTLSKMNFGDYPMVNYQYRISARFYGEEGPIAAAKAAIGQPQGRGSRTGAGPGHRDAGRPGLGRGNPHRARRARQPLARCAHRHGSQPALRSRRDHGNPRLRPPLGLAELDFHPPQRRRRRRRAEGLRQRQQGQVRLEPRLIPTQKKTPDPNQESTMSIDYSQKIPNNVHLNDNKTLQRALEHWQPEFINWWQDMGPDGSQNFDVYLRTAVSVDPSGWAHFDHVKMPDYRWGIFLNPAEEGRKVNFGAHKGEAAWQEVPGEYRSNLRRLIVTQGDTEPASVEQQRHLGLTCPSLYDMRNLFQVNVEEGRHLWAMVYLLHAYFGRDGREEAEALLERRSGDADNPRILGAFNERTPDWLSFFMFTYFTDRDGKYQLCSLAESGFDPLARTCKFMLTEEAHHMFVGESGVGRVIQRTCDVMNQLKTDDVAKIRAAGVIDLPTIQRYLNFHFSVTMDLFGADVSSNAATFYTTGLKGRYEETKQTDDHLLNDASYGVLEVNDGKLVTIQAPYLNAINEKLRDDYVTDAKAGIERWNKIIQKAGIPFTLSAPHKAFNRKIGPLSAAKISPRARWSRKPNGRIIIWHGCPRSRTAPSSAR